LNSNITQHAHGIPLIYNVISKSITSFVAQMDSGGRKRSRIKLIEQLKSEIAELDNELKEERAKKKIATHTSASKIVQYLLNSEAGEIGNNIVAASDYEQSIDQLDLKDEEKHVHYVTKLCAVTINDVHSSLVYIEHSNEIRRRYLMKGTSTMVPFSLTFDVDEVIKRIVTINFTVQDSIRREIAPLIDRLSSEKSVVSFLQALNRYTELSLHRHRVFSAVRAQHPAATAQSPAAQCASVLVVDAGLQSKFGFKVEWTFTFSGGRINQSIQIFPRISEEACKGDLKKELRNIPTRFQQLVKVKGPQAAIEIFILLATNRT
jgi:hypothetical protein